MITKQQLDDYFTLNYKQINNLIINIINQHKRKYDSSSLLSNGYEYLIQKLNEIPNKEDIQRWLITYAKNNIIWENSQIRKEEKIKNNIEINEYYDQIDDTDDLDYKIELEQRYTKQKDILNSYRHEYLTDKQKMIVFDVYFTKGQSSSRKMARHFNHRSHKAAWELIKQMKEDINYYIQNIYNNNDN